MHVNGRPSQLWLDAFALESGAASGAIAIPTDDLSLAILPAGTPRDLRLTEGMNILVQPALIPLAVRKLRVL